MGLHSRVTLELLVSQNDNLNLFVVSKPFKRTMTDELDLVPKDEILISRVFADGWAEGVSRRLGGPGIFPLWHLHGTPLKLMYLEFMDQRGMGASSSPRAWTNSDTEPSRTRRTRDERRPTTRTERRMSGHNRPLPQVPLTDNAIIAMNWMK
jgi:hypothetical protein